MGIPYEPFEDDIRKARKKFLKQYFERYKRLKEKIEKLEEEWGRAMQKLRTSKKNEKKKIIERWKPRAKIMRETEKEKTELIAELIKIEPSHLVEPWILWEVIGWLRTPGEEYVDRLKEAFINQAGRNRKTAHKEKQENKVLHLIITIQEIMDDKKVKRPKACEILAKRQANEETRDDFLPQGDLDNGVDLERVLYERSHKNIYSKLLEKENRLPYYKGKFFHQPRPYKGINIRTRYL